MQKFSDYQLSWLDFWIFDKKSFYFCYQIEKNTNLKSYIGLDDHYTSITPLDKLFDLFCFIMRFTASGLLILGLFTG